jgi:hypothetical protein
LRVDLSIAKLEIGAVDGLDGRVSEIGVNSLLNRIRSWSKLKRYQLTRGRRLAGERFSSAPPTIIRVVTAPFLIASASFCMFVVDKYTEPACLYLTNSLLYTRISMSFFASFGFTLLFQ